MKPLIRRPDGTAYRSTIVRGSAWESVMPLIGEEVEGFIRKSWVVKWHRSIFFFRCHQLHEEFHRPPQPTMTNIEYTCCGVMPVLIYNSPSELIGSVRYECPKCRRSTIPSFGEPNSDFASAIDTAAARWNAKSNGARATEERAKGEKIKLLEEAIVLCDHSARAARLEAVERIAKLEESLKYAMQLRDQAIKDRDTLVREVPSMPAYLKELGLKVRAINHANGWDVLTPADWPNDLSEADKVRKISTLLFLVTCEVSEAMEGLRKLDKPNVEEELADVMIRTLDIATGLGFDIGAAIDAKLAKNATRGHKHGGKAV